MINLWLHWSQQIFIGKGVEGTKFGLIFVENLVVERFKFFKTGKGIHSFGNEFQGFICAGSTGCCSCCGSCSGCGKKLSFCLKKMEKKVWV